ncbi:MAG: hypothetical protein OEX02_05710 [Cyclobacteriaceae bacterium]|nr:hypothetical protein [Cyclobacteriaceae bacterium]
MEKEIKNQIEPTFGGSFGNGWQVISDNFLALLLVVFVVGLVQMPIQVFRSIGEISIKQAEGGIQAIVLGSFFIFAITYGFLLLSVFDYGSSLMFVKAVRREKADFHNLIIGFKENYMNIVLANILVAGIIMLGIIFLVVPGIIFACKLAFVKYLVMDRKMGAIEAVEESWRMTNGYGWTIFAMGFVSFFIVILGLVMLIVGIFPAIMWVSSAYASLYEAVSVKNGTSEIVEDRE